MIYSSSIHFKFSFHPHKINLFHFLRDIPDENDPIQSIDVYVEPFRSQQYFSSSLKQK